MKNMDIAPQVARAGSVLMKDVMLAKPDEHVLITADDATDMAVVTSLKDAAHEVGAKVAVVVTPRMPCSGGFADPYIPDPVKAAITACDVWVELGFPYMVGSSAADAALEGGRTRYYLSPGLNSDSMVRIFTDVDLDDLFAVQHAFEEVLAKADGKECRITNRLGSDVTFKLDSATNPIGCCRAEKPGITALPGAIVILPDIETVKGVVKLESIFNDDIYIQHSEPLSVELDGKVQKISGGGSEHDVWETALKKAGGGKDYGYIIHFTCGIHPAAKFTGTCFIEDQRVIGNNAVGLGLPFWIPGGGETHPDSHLTRQSIWVDGKQVVKDGAIIGPPPLTKAARKLEAAAAV
jgi:2,5-dihydroxypyridine 5,6-dioxygenase